MDNKSTDNDVDLDQLPRRDYFWAIIAVGVIVVSIGAWFLGNFIAGKLLAPKSLDQGSIISLETTDTSEEAGGKVTVPGPAHAAKSEKRSRGSAEEAKSEKTERGSDNSGVVIKAGGKEAPPKTTEVEIKAEGKSGQADTAKKAPDKKTEAAANDNDAFITEEDQDDLMDNQDTKIAPEKQLPKETVAKPAAPAVNHQDIKSEEPPKQETEKPKNVIYVLQLGVYSSRENAEIMKKNLVDEYGLDVYIGKVEFDGETKFRVQVGAFKDKAKAQKLGRELQLKGYNYYISEKVVE